MIDFDDVWILRKGDIYIYEVKLNEVGNENKEKESRWFLFCRVYKIEVFV